AATGRDLYVPIGNLNVGDDGTDAHLETLDANARDAGARVRWLDSADLRREFPQFRRGRRALLEEEAGFLRATDCVATLRALAEKAGVQFATDQEADVEAGAGGLAARAGAPRDTAPPA